MDLAVSQVASQRLHEMRSRSERTLRERVRLLGHLSRMRSAVAAVTMEDFARGVG